jgi:hypothetical protein
MWPVGRWGGGRALASWVTVHRCQRRGCGDHHSAPAGTPPAPRNNPGLVDFLDRLIVEPPQLRRIFNLGDARRGPFPQGRIQHLVDIRPPEPRRTLDNLKGFRAEFLFALSIGVTQLSH